MPRLPLLLNASQRDAGATIDAGVDLRTGEHRIQVRVHNAGCRSGIGIDEVGVSISRIIRALYVAVHEEVS